MRNSKNTFYAALITMLYLFAFTACGPKNASAEANSDQASNNPDSSSYNGSDTTSNNSKDDNEYAMKAADGGMYEVELGKVAASRGTMPDVQRLGQMMVTDHSKANEELKAIAMKKNITLPTTLSEKMQKKLDDISKKQGADFDKAYSSNMVSDHEEDIRLFKKEAAEGTDAELRAFAQGKIPTLEHHLDMAKTAKQAAHK